MRLTNSGAYFATVTCICTCLFLGMVDQASPADVTLNCYLMSYDHDPSEHIRIDKQGHRVRTSGLGVESDWYSAKFTDEYISWIDSAGRKVTLDRYTGVLISGSVILHCVPANRQF